MTKTEEIINAARVVSDAGADLVIPGCFRVTPELLAVYAEDQDECYRLIAGVSKEHYAKFKEWEDNPSRHKCTVCGKSSMDILDAQCIQFAHQFVPGVTDRCDEHTEKSE